MGLIEKIFGNYSQKEIRRIDPLVKKVLALENTYRNMSEEELRSQTAVLKERLANGETLDDILPEAFAGNEAAQAVLRRTAKPGPGGLSPREREIARLAAARRTNAEIAAQLHLSEATVKNHLKRIFDKLGLDGSARGKRNLLADILSEKISP